MRRWRGLVILSGLLLAVIAAGSWVVIRTPAAQAAPFACGSNDWVCRDLVPRLNSQWDSLCDGASLAGGKTPGSATIVPAGTSITFHARFNRNSSYTGAQKSSSYIWTMIDGDTTAVTLNVGNSPVPPSAHPAYAGQPCPRFYDANGDHPSNATSPFPDSHFSNYAHESTAQPGQHYDEYYPVSDPDSGQNGHVTCGNTGLFHYWYDGTQPLNSQDHPFTVTIGGDSLTASFCVRTYLSIGTMTQIYARSNQPQCYKVDPVTVSGNVHTDRTSGSGRPIANTNTVISVWRAGGSTNPVSTDATGNYSFQTTRGQLYNITARSPINYQGTNYTLSNPTTPYISTCPANCANRDFVYTPDVKYPVIRKTANVANGAAVSPGQAISYTITSQTDSDYSPASDVFEDWLPLNLDYDPTSLRASIIVDPSSANKPTNYYIDLGSSIPCDGLSHTLFYGITSVIGVPSVRCTYTPGSAGTPARVSLSASRMPPYALATLRFGGTVKPASQVGVYPGNPNRYPGNPSPTNADFRYCNNTGAADFTNQASIMANCQDYTEGLQGLMNAAVQAINGDVFTLSHITPMLYNPIPGRVSTVTKDYTNKDGAGNFIYNPTDPILNNGIFSIQVNHDPSSGPVYYRVNDQAGPSTLDPAMAYSAGSCNVVAGVTLGSGGNNCSSGGAQGPILWAGGSPSGLIDNRTATSDSPLYNFRVTWPIGGVLGQVHCNTPQIVGIDYSVWPHANFSKTPLAPTCVTYAYSTSPGISANNGNIYAGGVPTPGSSCFGGTGNVNLSNSTSQFLVAASGATISGVASPSSSRSYLIRCRDDMSTAAQQLVSGGVISSPVGSDAGFDGKVKQGPSGVVIPAGGLNVNSRWTLYVPGDVYIRGNIVRTGANAMMGIIATGNVYISPGVTQVDALVVSSAGKIYTCGNGPGAVFQSPGVDVNTCSNTLTVNGLFMAKDIKFDRTYPYCAPNCSLLGARERFSLPASLYTLVPPAFTTPSSQPGAVQFKGEAAPRY